MYRASGGTKQLVVFDPRLNADAINRKSRAKCFLDRLKFFRLIELLTNAILQDTLAERRTVLRPNLPNQRANNRSTAGSLSEKLGNVWHN